MIIPEHLDSNSKKSGYFRHALTPYSEREKYLREFSHGTTFVILYMNIPFLKFSQKFNFDFCYFLIITFYYESKARCFGYYKILYHFLNTFANKKRKWYNMQTI